MLYSLLFSTTLFLLATFIAIRLFYHANSGKRIVLLVLAGWALALSVLGLSGFFMVTDTIPPRLAFLILPPLVLIVLFFIIPQGRAHLDQLDIKSLTLLHSVRVLVEIVLYTLFLQKLMPHLMTFEGRNYDILSGLTAPLVYYFGLVRKRLGLPLLLAWNIICFCILFFTVLNGILSAPGPFQQFAFDQPNVAVFYFPFALLPGLVVPLVFLAHFVSIRKLVRMIRIQHKAPLAVSV